MLNITTTGNSKVDFGEQQINYRGRVAFYWKMEESQKVWVFMKGSATFQRKFKGLGRAASFATKLNNPKFDPNYRKGVVLEIVPPTGKRELIPCSSRETALIHIHNISSNEDNLTQVSRGHFLSVTSELETHYIF